MLGTGLSNTNGILPVVGLKALAEMERTAAEAANQKPIIQGLAAHIRECFDAAKQYKEHEVEQRMLQSIRQRRGEYEPEVLAQIRAQGGSEIYMMLTSNKCRAAASWIKDTLLGAADDKPWSLEPTTIPELSPADMEGLIQQANEEAMLIQQTLGPQAMTPHRLRQIALSIRDDAMARIQDAARETAQRMERKMEDQLQEGGFHRALMQFADDLTTFPAAIIKGPVIRKRKQLKWAGETLDVVEVLGPEWERVDPLMAYPSPSATSTHDGYFIERHKLSRSDIAGLIGVPGYNEGAVRAVLNEYGTGGLNQWLSVDSQRADAEGKPSLTVVTSPDPTIDALQYWGSVPGRMLVEWGLEADEETIDPDQEYECEAWLIGSWVVKAVLNPDPLGRRPYYKTAYEEIPGTFWGNSVADLVRDCQNMCNAAARALANNMGISSGPQVWVNNDRLADGETVTQMFPWKIWQSKSDPYGNNSAPPIDFFQPQSNAPELMAIYDRFSIMADEFSGIPRYMTGDANVGGAGRTASGMSMLMGNAGKVVKQVMSNVDINVIGPLIDRLYYHNMRYGEDPDLKGDVRVVARGVNALVAKDAAQVRRNEFLNIALTNPIVSQIVGEEAIADLLRETAKTLDMNTSRIVPTPEKLRARMAMMQMAAMQQPQMAQGPQTMPQNGQTLADGSPVTDTFSPARGA